MHFKAVVGHFLPGRAIDIVGPIPLQPIARTPIRKLFLKCSRNPPAPFRSPTCPFHCPVSYCLPIQALLVKHGDSHYWRTLKAEVIPLLDACRFR